jgi:hypothetical protein
MAVRRYTVLRGYVLRLDGIAHEMHKLQKDMEAGGEDVNPAERLRGLRERVDELARELRDAAQNVT